MLVCLLGLRLRVQVSDHRPPHDSRPTRPVQSWPSIDPTPFWIEIHFRPVRWVSRSVLISVTSQIGRRIGLNTTLFQRPAFDLPTPHGSLSTLPWFFSPRHLDDPADLFASSSSSLDLLISSEIRLTWQLRWQHSSCFSLITSNKQKAIDSSNVLFNKKK